MLEEGVSQAEVARRLGVKRQSVHQWAKVMAAQGEKGLVRVPTGRKPRLNEVQLAQLAEHLQDGPQAHAVVRGKHPAENQRGLPREEEAQEHRGLEGRDSKDDQ